MHFDDQEDFLGVIMAFGLRVEEKD